MKTLIVLAVFAGLAVVVSSEDDFQSFKSEDAHAISKRGAGCNTGECSKFCRKTGYARGVCIGSYCQCRSRRRRSLQDVLNVELDVPHAVKREIQGPPLFPPCVFYECIGSCRQKRFKGGYCTIRGCQCTK